MINQHQLEELFIKHGFDDYKLIPGIDINVAQWVRLKCMYGCDNYGKNSTCPPNVPSVSECRKFFSEYKSAAVFHMKKKYNNEDEVMHWCNTINNKLIKLEKEVFLCGYYKAFVLYIDQCNICTSCESERSECRNKKIARPCTEALAVDVYETARKLGYPINVIKDWTEKTNRYAILLIE